MTSDLFECFKCGDVFESQYGPVRCPSCNSADTRYVLDPKEFELVGGSYQLVELLKVN